MNYAPTVCLRAVYKLLTYVITNEISDYLKILTFSPINEHGASVFTAEKNFERTCILLDPSSFDKNFTSLILYEPCIILQYVYNQQNAQFFVIRLYLQYTLYMFRTVSVHFQEQSFFIKCMSYLVYAGTIRLAVVLL